MKPSRVLITQIVSLAVASYGLAVASPASAAAPAPASPPASSEKRLEGFLTRPDSISAMVTARSLDEPVVDLSGTDELTLSIANPDGSWTSDTAPEPVRAKNEADVWAPIDLTLIPTDEGLAPANALGDVVISDGGDTGFASMEVQGKDFEWQWPARLPEPEVSGSTATYRDVVDGTGDLVVTATATGFRHDIVLNERPDAPMEFDIPLVTSGPKLAEQADGSLTIETRNGKELIEGSEPVMYDSSPEAAGDPAEVQVVDAEVSPTGSGSTLTLTPDPEFLADPDTTYPVVIDPTFNSFPSQDSWVGGADLNSTHAWDPNLYVGTRTSGQYKYRSFIQFPTEPKWKNAKIESAGLYLRNHESLTCSGWSIRVSRVTQDWSSRDVTWNNQPAVAATGAVDSTDAFGYSSACPAADMNWDVKSYVEQWATGTPNYGVRVAGVTETSNNSYRVMRSANTEYGNVAPRLKVTYNNYPAPASKPTVAPGNAGYATTTTPELSTTVTDPDGTAPTASFEILDSAGNVKWSGSSAAGATGSTRKITVPSSAGLVTGATYSVKAKGYDGSLYSTSWSPSTAFTVDTTKPTVTVTSSAFTHNQWTSSVPASNTFLFTGPGDTAAFAYTLDGVEQPARAADGTGKATLAWRPTSGLHTLTVTPIDQGGNAGAAVSFTFGVGAPAFDTPNQAARSTGAFMISASAPPDSTGATLSWRYASTTTWHSVTKATKAGAPWTGAVVANGPATTMSGILWDPTSEPISTTPAGSQRVEAPALLEIRACFEYSATTVCGPTRNLQLVPSAFGENFPEAQLGVASLALFTGEMTLSEPDAIDTSVGAGRSFSSYDSATTKAGAFGPGWATALLAQGDTVGLLDRRDVDGSLVLVSAGNASETFVATGAPVNGLIVYRPADVDDGSRLEVGASTARLIRAQGPVTTWTLNSTSNEWELASSATQASAQSPNVSVDTSGGYLTWIAEIEPGMSSTCTATTQTAGCRGLRINYTGSGTAKRVDKIERVAAGSPTVALATYSYDAQNRLASVCDPRVSPQLCSSYTYTSLNGRTLLASATPAGQTAWRFGYDPTGRLTTVKRALDASSGSGDATWTAVYDLPLGASGLPSMTQASVDQWGQLDAPRQVFAVFDPSKVPAASVPTSAELEHANLWYTDDEGKVSNTAAFGAGNWLIDTQWLDEHGNVVRELDGAGRLRALTAPAADRPRVAMEASSLTVYNEHLDSELDARRVEDSFGPVHTATLRDGTTGPFRARTSYIYDDEATIPGDTTAPAPPDGQPALDLVVETRSSATKPDQTGNFDEQVVRNLYGPVVAGDGDGWKLGIPTRVQTRLDDGTWSTRITRSDTQGRQVETRQPGGAAKADGSGADARSTFTMYYAAGAPDPECNTTTLGKPAWVGLECKTGPAAQPTGNTMPITVNVDFDGDLRPTRVEQRSGATSRVITSTYDALGRPTAETISIGSKTRSTSTGYDPATGLPATETSSGATVRTGYDSWGRVNSYVDASDLTSITTYTPDGQIATHSDGVGTYAYTYDNATEHRRLPTGIAFGGGVSGSMTMNYNARGALATVTYPHGLKRVHTYNEVGVPTGLVYTGADATELLSFGNTLDVDGRVVGAASTASNQDYRYDALGRLTQVQDKRNGGCSTRAYAFSPASERTSSTTYAPASNADCQTLTAQSARTSTYDTANRVRNVGYTYDDLGRTLTVPAIETSPEAAGELTVAYEVNDMVKSVAQSVTNGDGSTSVKSASYGLDPKGRVNAITNSTGGVETDRLRYRFSDESDSPTSIDASQTQGSTWSTTRYLSALGIGMVGSVQSGIVTWQLSNLKGHTVATSSDAVSLQGFSETDENGAVTDQSSTKNRYGWLGSVQRSSDSVGGLLLMGVRLYNPRTGLFLSPDSVQDGNVTQYGYPEDPVNQADPDGRASLKKWWGGFKTYEGRFTYYMRIWLNKRILRKLMWGTLAYAAAERIVGEAIGFCKHPICQLVSKVFKISGAIKAALALGIHYALEHKYGIGIKLAVWKKSRLPAPSYPYFSSFAYDYGA